MKKYLLLTFVAFYFTSCDPYGGYRHWIENNSNTDLILEYKKNSNDTIYFIEINPNTQILVEKFRTINGKDDLDNSFLNSFFETFIIHKDSINGSLINKDFMNRDNWHYEFDSKGCLGNCGNNIYYFNIKNTDL